MNEKGVINQPPASAPQVQFSDPPPDVIPNVQIVTSALSNANSQTNKQIFFSDPPPDIVQNVQIVTETMSSQAAVAVTHRPEWMNSNDLERFSHFAGHSLAMEAPSNPENFQLLKRGSWNDKVTLTVQGGQAMWFKVHNTNDLGTTISISDQNGQIKQSVILPESSVEFVFSVFGAEPINWHFDIRSDSDVFKVDWELWSSWVPVMQANK